MAFQFYWNQYNQIVKILYHSFSEKRLLAFLFKLEKKP
ncbi:plasmid mobilization protein [Chryseobacterium pennae]